MILLPHTGFSSFEQTRYFRRYSPGPVTARNARNDRKPHPGIYLDTAAVNNSALRRRTSPPPQKVQRRGLLVASRQRASLLEVKTCELDAGQSKSHAFDVGPYATSSTREDSSAEESDPAAKVRGPVAPTIVQSQSFQRLTHCQLLLLL